VHNRGDGGSAPRRPPHPTTQTYPVAGGTARAARRRDTVALLTTYVPHALQICSPRPPAGSQSQSAPSDLRTPPRLIRVSRRVPIDSQEQVRRVSLSRGEALRLAHPGAVGRRSDLRRARRVTFVDDRQAESGNARVGIRRRTACRIVASTRHCFSGGDAHPVIRLDDFDAANRVVWSIIHRDTAGSSDAISMPVDGASQHTLRAWRPCRPAG
jgi:hypothetical protein